MFSRLAIVDAEIDVGAIAEAIVYYGKVSVIGHAGLLGRLVREFGYDNLTRCLDMGLLEYVYTRSIIAVQNTPGKTLFDVGAVALVPEARAKGRRPPFAESERIAVAEELDELLPRVLGKSTNVHRIAQSLSERVDPFVSHSPILEGVRRDALDEEYVRNTICGMAHVRGKPLPPDFRIKLKEFDGRILFHADLDYDLLGFDPVSVMSAIATAREQLTHSASGQSEVWVTPLIAPVIEGRINTFARRAIHSHERIESFSKIVLEGPSFREAINSGECSITNLLGVLEREQAQRFKKWLGSLPPNAQLVTEYHRAIFSESPTLSSLPIKFLRSALFVGLGTLMATAPISALTASAGVEALARGEDVVEKKLLGGWRPNQFVDLEARPFLKNQ